MIAIIDYDAGNIFSVQNALEYLGEKPVLTRDANVLKNADRIILPGVGAFGDCMDKITSYELVPVIEDVVKMGIPFLGVCLGMQLLFDSSEENEGVKGLSLLKGKIRKIPIGEYKKIPHMGWNSITFPKKSKLFNGINEGAYVYFVHSYCLHADDLKVVSARCNYNVTFDAAVEHENIFGCQFHPEKSSEVGLRVLKNFIEID